MTAARLQRYALFLTGFDNIEYKSMTTEALQYWRIIYAPSSAEGEGGDGSGFVGRSQRKPVRATTGNNLEVAREIRRDQVLSRVHESIVKGWSTLVGEDKP